MEIFQHLGKIGVPVNALVKVTTDGEADEGEGPSPEAAAGKNSTINATK